MTGKRLLMRILMALALAGIALALLAAMSAEATPIRPDIKKLVEQPQQDATAQSMPARAGWDGPEMPAGKQIRIHSSLESMSGAVLARERAELWAAATPDPRAILGIVAVIFLLRLLKQQEEKRVSSLPQVSPLQDDEQMAA